MVRIMKKRILRIFAVWMLLLSLMAVGMLYPLQPVFAAESMVPVTAPSVILLEVSTGKVIYEVDADRLCLPASITKIMTMLLIFEALDKGEIRLSDEVITSPYAQSMGGSQVFLEAGELQTVDTLLKCIAVSSGNDAAVAMAEHIAGSEQAFVERMNRKAEELGMNNTEFEDCCGLTDSEGHHTTARDVAIMSRVLVTTYPQVYEYTGIWMEDITHTTPRGSSQFTLSSTNKLLKQYQWTTGLKTGSTSKAGYCISATARKDNMELIAVVMTAPDSVSRFADAAALLNYGYSVSKLYKDYNKEEMLPVKVKGGIADTVLLAFASGFTYLDVEGNDVEMIQKNLILPKEAQAPVKAGQQAGEARYTLHGKVIGTVPVLYAVSVNKAYYMDYVKKIIRYFLL